MRSRAGLVHGLIVVLFGFVACADDPRTLDAAVQRVQAGDLSSSVLLRLAASADLPENCPVVLEALGRAVDLDETGIRARSKMFAALMECERLESAASVAREFERAVEAYPASTTHDRTYLRSWSEELSVEARWIAAVLQSVSDKSAAQGGAKEPRQDAGKVSLGVQSEERLARCGRFCELSPRLLLSHRLPPAGILTRLSEATLNRGKVILIGADKTFYIDPAQSAGSSRPAESEIPTRSAQLNTLQSLTH